MVVPSLTYRVEQLEQGADVSRTDRSGLHAALGEVRRELASVLGQQKVTNLLLAGVILMTLGLKLWDRVDAKAAARMGAAPSPALGMIAPRSPATR